MLLKIMLNYVSFNIVSRLQHEATVRAVMKHEMKNNILVRKKKLLFFSASLKFELLRQISKTNLNYFVRSQKHKLFSED
jgi:vacuolar-type H+-ATPase subunit B/Vma2